MPKNKFIITYSKKLRKIIYKKNPYFTCANIKMFRKFTNPKALIISHPSSKRLKTDNSQKSQ